MLINERLINMPPNIAPDLHTQLPEDLKFTKEQDDIKDPKEFNYDYILVQSKFTVDNQSAKNKPKRDEWIYYRWEDSVFEPKAEISFNFQSSFKDVADDGKKSYTQGATEHVGGGSETQYRLIYLIKWDQYVKLSKQLQSHL